MRLCHAPKEGARHQPGAKCATPYEDRTELFRSITVNRNLFSFVGARFFWGGLTLLALVTFGLALWLPGELARAQDNGLIMYPENGEVAVATYTATDPEDAGAIKWSLAAGDDAEDFEIGESSGVLTFAETPDYEMAADGDTNNEYTVTVVATDADSMTTEKVVMVEVTNEEEAGTVTLSAVAPYPGVELTATHTDPDGQIAGTEWQWSRSRSKSGSYTDIEDAKAAAYTTESGDVGFYLRATVTYNDGEGEGKSAMATSVHTVQAINLPNNAPVFPDQDPDTSGDQSDTATRMVEEKTRTRVRTWGFRLKLMTLTTTS